MYEIMAIITDHLGSRPVPTGLGSINRNVAENLMLKQMIADPTIPFYIYYNQSQDEWNAN